MPKLTKFEDYKDKYPNFRLEKTDDNILLCQMHTDGGELFFDWRAHDDLSDVFSDISGDRELSVVIFTGTGDSFIDKYGPIDTTPEVPGSLRLWGRKARHERILRSNPAHEHARDSGADHRGGQRPVQHSFGAAGHVRHRACVRRCILPGLGPRAPRIGARRRCAHRLAPRHRAEPALATFYSPDKSCRPKKRSTTEPSTKCCLETSSWNGPGSLPAT